MVKTKRAESRSRYYIRAQAARRGWDIRHLERGGDFLEEQEIIDRFPSIGLGLNKPDFVRCLSGEPKIVIEAKNDIHKITKAISEAIEYADQINSTGHFHIPIVIGAAGEEDAGFIVEVRYLTSDGWRPLISHEHSITSIPSKREAELAIEADDATTQVSIPSGVEFTYHGITLPWLSQYSWYSIPMENGDPLHSNWKVICSEILRWYQTLVDTNWLNLSYVNDAMQA